MMNHKKTDDPKASRINKEIRNLGIVIFKMAYTFPDNETYEEQLENMLNKSEFPNEQCLNIFDDWKSDVLEMTDPDYKKRPAANEILANIGWRILIWINKFY